MQRRMELPLSGNSMAKMSVKNESENSKLDDKRNLTYWIPFVYCNRKTEETYERNLLC